MDVTTGSQLHCERDFRGVYSVLCTPFADDGSLDLRGVRAIVEDQVEAGVAGVVCFGLASESYKLSDSERASILHAALAAADSRVGVIVGTEHSSTEVAIERAMQARDAGASALMLLPPSFVKPDAEQVIDYYASVAAAAQLPLVVQDAPAWTAVPLPVPLLARIGREVPAAAHAKVEAPPTAPKIAALEQEGVECIGGYGGLYLDEELERGVTATMPGCGFPRAFVDILRLHGAGKPAEALSRFRSLLPLLVFGMASLDLFVGLHKHLLCQRGLIASPRLRRPALLADEQQLRRGEKLLQEAGLPELGVRRSGPSRSRRQAQIGSAASQR